MLEDLYIHDVKGDDRFSGDGKGTGGIYVHVAGSLKTKIDDLQILNNRIEDVGRSGISLLSNWQTGNNFSNRFYMTNVVVSGNTIRRTGGDGMIVIGLKDAILQYNTVSDANYSGPRYQMDNVSYTGAWAVGMFPFFTDGTTIQYNEVYNTRTCDDGQAIDVDGQNNGTVVQYNFTHDNEGGAFLAMVDTYNNSRTLNTTFRYNVSQNDARTVFSLASVRNVLIYNNTVFVGKDMWTKVVGYSSNGSNVYAKNVEFTNNLFAFFGTRDQDFNGPGAGDVKFTNNWYYGDWKGQMPNESSMELRRSEPGFLNAGAMPDNWNVEASDMITDLSNRSAAITQYQLNSNSPLIDAGIKVKEYSTRVVPIVYPITSSTNDNICDGIFNSREELNYDNLTDFWGQPALSGSVPDIGAFEYQGDRQYTMQNNALISFGAEPYIEKEPLLNIIENDSEVSAGAAVSARVAGSENGVQPFAGGRMLNIVGEGLAAGDKASILLFNFNGSPITMNTNTKLSFMLYAAAPSDAHVSIDGVLDKGGKLRDIPALNLNPANNGTTPTGAWQQISADLSSLAGISLTSLSIRIDGGSDALGTVNAYIDDIRITDQSIVPNPPSAENTVIEGLTDGKAPAGSAVKGRYTYVDINGEKEDGFSYQWYISDDGISYKAITGATARTYTPSGANLGKYIKFGVKPANRYLEGFNGMEALSEGILVYGFEGMTGFEPNEFPARSLIKYTSLRTPIDPDFQVFMDIKNNTSFERAHSGTASYKVSGLTCLQYVPFTDTIMVNKLFDTNYTITPNTKLSYWMYAENDASRYAGIDFAYGANLKFRNSDILDMAGGPSAPKAAHGGVPTGQWTNIIVDLGSLAGQPINELYITANPAGVTGKNISAYFDDITFIEADTINEGIPEVANVAISGIPKTSKVLTASYYFRSPTGNPEEGSVYEWQRGESAEGTFETIHGTRQSLTYTLTNDDAGQYIRFVVTPKTAAMTGAEYDAVIGPIGVIPADDEAPVASNVYISTNFAGMSSGGVLTGNYTYSDREGDVENASTYRWLLSSEKYGEYTAIEDSIAKTLVLTDAMFGKYIKFEVTPANDNKVGIPVLSSPSGRISGFLFEAENMQLDNGFEVNTLNGANASQNKVIRIKSSMTGQTGTATQVYNSLDGIYDLNVYYYVENDGQVAFTVALNGAQIGSWAADKNLGSSDPITNTRTFFSIKGVPLKNNDAITIKAIQNGAEWARTDCIVLIPSGYDVTLQQTENGVILSDAFNGKAQEGENVVFTFIPSSGYKLKEALVNGSPVTPVNGTYILKSINGDVTASAIFVEDTLPPKEYKVEIVQARKGAITSNAKNGIVLENGSVEFTFTPDKGYYVSSAYINGTAVEPVDGKYSLTGVNSNISVTAEFIKDKYYKVKIKKTTGGEVSSDTADGEVPEGGRVVLTFIAYEGYHIEKAFVNDVEVILSEGSYTVENVNKKVTVSAIFVEDEVQN